MLTSTDTTAATGNNLFATSLDVGRTLFESAERMTTLNFNTARSLFEDGGAAFAAALAAKSTKELADVQASFARPLGEKLLAYYRSAYEIAAQTLEEAMKPFELQLSDANRNFGRVLETAAKSAPAGSEIALAAVRSAIATANSAYDRINRAARQVVDLTEANVSNATANAAAAINTAGKRGD